MIPKIPVEPDDDDEQTGPPTRFWRRPGVVLIAVLGVAIVGYAAFRPKDAPKHTNAQKHNDTFIGEVVGYQPPTPIVTPARAQDRADMLPEPPPPPPAPAAPPPPPPPAPQAEKPPMPSAPSLRNFLPANPGQQAQPRNKMMVYAVPPPPAPPTPRAPPDETSIAFKTAEIPGFKASAAIDETYMLMPGLLPMVLDTAINSDVPGPILAHLPGPVYSRKGVLLMEANTQIIGNYGSMGKGSRLMAVSTVAHTPNGVWVPLTGQTMSDDLGRAGLDGEVNRHLMQRFGPAVLLSLAGQGLGIIQAEASKGGNTYLNLGNGGGGGGGIESLATQILQSQINIPDTFNKHQGETIALFLDKPVDFSASYRIHQVKAQ
jgi:type IV secretion system protein VirB10